VPFAERDHVGAGEARRFHNEVLLAQDAGRDMGERWRYVGLVVRAKAREVPAQAELQAIAQARQVRCRDDDQPTGRNQASGLAQRAPGSLQVLDHLDEQHAVGGRQRIGVLGRHGVKAHIRPQIVIEPINRIGPTQRVGLPFISYLAQQISTSAADVEPAQSAFGTGGVEGCLHDLTRGCARGVDLV